MFNPMVSQVCGMKVKRHVQRRCRSCTLVYRQGRLHNYCKDFPRHNQMQKLKKPKSTWILTSSSMSPKRPW